MSNKAASAPCDRDGKVIDDVRAQPPCLLRYSPAAFAAEAPAFFRHDPATNQLALQPGVPEPWLRVNRAGGDPTEWLFCQECKSRYFPSPGQRRHSHVPYRDRASQGLMKSVTRSYQPTGRKEVGKEEEEEVGAGSGSEASATLQEEVAPVLPGPDEEAQDEMEVAEEVLPLPGRPTLDEYRAKWALEEAKYARSVPLPFSIDNLVPQPVPQLWQDCPHVPFAQLRSDDAQSRLAVVKPISGMEQASVNEGVPRYAHNSGDVCFRRRGPWQLAGTLGFLLNRRDGKFLHLTPAEESAVHECLTWARDGNNRVLTFFGTVFETFVRACGLLMQKFVLPEGSLRARIRASKNANMVDAELGTTLGTESCGMVVVDHSGFPLRCGS